MFNMTKNGFYEQLNEIDMKVSVSFDIKKRNLLYLCLLIERDLLSTLDVEDKKLKVNLLNMFYNKLF